MKNIRTIVALGSAAMLLGVVNLYLGAGLVFYLAVRGWIMYWDNREREDFNKIMEGSQAHNP